LTHTRTFLKALEQEMQMTGRSSLEFDTVYLGGGTPTVLNADEIASLLSSAFSRFNIRSDVETTVEVNPGTVTLADLKRYYQAGVNRLNIGIQSFLDQNLDFLGRIHSGREAASCIEWARQAGFDNVGLDLIYGLPEHKEQHWLDDLNAAVACRPEHLSCYMLTREAGTPLDRELAAGRIGLPSGDQLRRLFDSTIEFLTGHGYQHYEISNFARLSDSGSDSRISRHNSKYWSLAPYIGLGPSAHSFLDFERRWNHRRLDHYLSDIRNGSLPVAASEQLTREQMILETIYLGFRTAAGIELDGFRRRFGIDFNEVYQSTIGDLKQEGLLDISETHCALSRSGMALLDSVTAEFTCQEVPDDR
jgi:oxygen-independent coproporphyrinogen-3 oxidase